MGFLGLYDRQKVTGLDSSTQPWVDRKHPALADAVARGCEVIARRWTPQLLIVLMQGPARFIELAAAVPGLSGRVMSERLKDLQKEGLVSRTVDPGPPITSTYRLTAEGERLRPAIVALCGWAEGRERINPTLSQ